MNNDERAEALRRLSDSLQAALNDADVLEALSQMLDYDKSLLRNDAEKLSGTVEALEGGSLYEFNVNIDFDSEIEFDNNLMI